MLTVFGPNGAGKTTLLKILAGLLRPSAGSVVIAGVDATRAPNSLRRLIGMISHQPYLYPQLTGRENLEFYARLYGLDDPRGRAAPHAGGDGAHRRRRQGGRRLLARHAAAAGRGPRPPARPPGAAAGRAVHRTRPAGPGAALRPPARAPRRRADGGHDHPRHRRRPGPLGPGGGAGPGQSGTRDGRGRPRSRRPSRRSTGRRGRSGAPSMQARG